MIGRTRAERAYVGFGLAFLAIFCIPFLPFMIPILARARAERIKLRERTGR
jgi:hypothetical protein